MAAVTPTSLLNDNMGSRNLIVARFSGTVNDGDTWTSGISGVKYYWSQDRDNPTTQTSAGLGITESAGVFTFYPSEDAKLFDLFVAV